MARLRDLCFEQLEVRARNNNCPKLVKLDEALSKVGAISITIGLGKALASKASKRESECCDLRVLSVHEGRTLEVV